MTSWWKWRDAVVAQVRFWPDRAKIAEELDAHYEDHVKDLERIGFDHELAEQRALQAMGDAVEVGRAMDKAHKPGLGCLWLISKWGAILCVTVLVLMFFAGDWQNRIKEPAQRSGDYEPNGASCFSEDSWEHENSERIMIGKGVSTVSRNGDVLSIPYAAVWKCSYPGDSKTGEGAFVSYWMTLILAADDRNPFDTYSGGFLDSLLLTYDDGRFFTQNYERIGTDENGKGIWGPGDGVLRGGIMSFDPLRTLYRITQYGTPTPPGEWCELSCSLGEPWGIRIEWEVAEP